MDEQRPNAEQSLQLPARSRRRSRAKRRSFAAGDVPLKVPLTPLRPGKRARSPPSSPVRTPAARPPLSADEYASMVGSAARQKRLGWGEGAASGEAASPGDLTAHVAPDVGRRGSRQSSRRSSSSSSDDGQRWQRAGAPLTTKRPSQPLPPLPPGAKIAAGGSDEEALLSRVYTVLREQVKHPRVLIVALRCLFVLLARAGAHTKPPGPEREEMLVDVLHVMRAYPRHGGVLAAANMTVGLFTSMRLPPMLAEQESYVEEFLEWEKMRVSPTFSLPCICVSEDPVWDPTRRESICAIHSARPSPSPPALLTRAAVASAERPAACHPARAAAPATAAHRVCVQRVGGLREAALLPTPGAAAVHQHRACCAMEPVGWLGGA